MDCLIDYIGIRNCGGDIPESGLYINSLPGISLESIDKIATEDQITYMGVWADVQAEAAIRFRVDVIMAVTNCFKLDSDCDYTTLICDNRDIIVNAWRYLLGNQLMLFRLYTTRLNRFTTVDLEQAAQLRDFYQVEYEKSLKQSVNLIDVTECRMCCGGNPEVVTWLP